MGEVAARYADLIIITSDNSRSESPEEISAEIKRGVESQGKILINGRQDSPDEGYQVVLSRREAIARAIGLAGRGDAVLISGKGHETYQISREGTVFFDDRLEAADQLEKIQ